MEEEEEEEEDKEKEEEKEKKKKKKRASITKPCTNRPTALVTEGATPRIHGRPVKSVFRLVRFIKGSRFYDQRFDRGDVVKPKYLRRVSARNASRGIRNNSRRSFLMFLPRPLFRIGANIKRRMEFVVVSTLMHARRRLCSATCFRRAPLLRQRQDMRELSSQSRQFLSLSPVCFSRQIREPGVYPPPPSFFSSLLSPPSRRTGYNY